MMAWSMCQLENNPRPLARLLPGNVFTYFNLIFAVFAVLLAFVRSYNNMTFLPVIISNMFIGIIQEIKLRRFLINLRWLMHLRHRL